MYPAKFDYHRAESIEEAIDLLARHAGAKLLAGGHSLLPMMKLRLAQPPTLVDVGRIASLKGICRDGDAVAIGALTSHGEIAASGEVATHCPLLAEAAGKIGDPAVRNKGTIGGNIAHADPASDLPAVLVAVGATVHLAGPGGQRQVAAGDFFLDLLTTDLGEGEIITRVDVPVKAAATGHCYLKHEHPASGYAVVGAAAVMTLDGGRVAVSALCFNGISATPHHADGVAASLAGQEPTDEAIAAAVASIAVDDPLGDVHASGPYRVELARVYGRRALAAARDRA